METKWHGQHCDSYDAVPQVQDMGPVGLTPHGELFLCLYLLLHLQQIKSSVINILFIFQLQYVTYTHERHALWKIIQSSLLIMRLPTLVLQCIYLLWTKTFRQSNKPLTALNVIKHAEKKFTCYTGIFSTSKCYDQAHPDWLLTIKCIYGMWQL